MPIPLLPTLSLLLSLLTAAVIFRVYAWRGTLSLKTLALAFSFGCVGASVMSVFLQGLPAPYLNGGSFWRHVVGYTTGPAYEEIAKAVPVFVLLAYARTSRRLSIADFALVGFLSGLGFVFIEQNFSRTLHNPGWTAVTAGWDTVWGLRFELTKGGASFKDYWPGHHAVTALVGLAAGIGAALWPTGRLKWALPLAMLAYVTALHQVSNYDVHYLLGGTRAVWPLAILFWKLSLNGLLPVLVLPVAVMAATTWESRRLRAATSPDDTLKLEGEGGSSALAEVMTVIGRLAHGRTAAAKAFGYMRSRRAALIARWAATRPDADEADRAYAVAAHDKLAQARPPAGRVEEDPGAAFQAFLQRYRWVLILAGVAFVMLAFKPSRTGLIALLHLPATRPIIALVAAGFVGWRIRLWFRKPRPQPQTAGGEDYATYGMQGLLLCGSVATSTLTLAGVFLKSRGWLPIEVDSIYYDYSYISGHLSRWTGAGGSLTNLMGVGAAAAAAAATPGLGRQSADDALASRGGHNISDPAQGSDRLIDTPFVQDLLARMGLKPPVAMDGVASAPVDEARAAAELATTAPAPPPAEPPVPPPPGGAAGALNFRGETTPGAGDDVIDGDDPLTEDEPQAGTQDEVHGGAGSDSLTGPEEPDGSDSLTGSGEPGEYMQGDLGEDDPAAGGSDDGLDNEGNPLAPDDPRELRRRMRSSDPVVAAAAAADWAKLQEDPDAAFGVIDKVALAALDAVNPLAAQMYRSAGGSATISEMWKLDKMEELRRTDKAIYDAVGEGAHKVVKFGKDTVSLVTETDQWDSIADEVSKSKAADLARKAINLADMGLDEVKSTLGVLADKGAANLKMLTEGLTLEELESHLGRAATTAEKESHRMVQDFWRQDPEKMRKTLAKLTVENVAMTAAGGALEAGAVAGVRGLQGAMRAGEAGLEATGGLRAVGATAEEVAGARSLAAGEELAAARAPAVDVGAVPPRKVDLELPTANRPPPTAEVTAPKADLEVKPPAQTPAAAQPAEPPPPRRRIDEPGAPAAARSEPPAEPGSLTGPQAADDTAVVPGRQRPEPSPAAGPQAADDTAVVPGRRRPEPGPTAGPQAADDTAVVPGRQRPEPSPTAGPQAADDTAVVAGRQRPEPGPAAGPQAAGAHPEPDELAALQAHKAESGGEATAAVRPRGEPDGLPPDLSPEERAFLQAHKAESEGGAAAGPRAPPPKPWEVRPNERPFGNQEIDPQALKPGDQPAPGKRTPEGEVTWWTDPKTGNKFPTKVKHLDEPGDAILGAKKGAPVVPETEVPLPRELLKPDGTPINFNPLDEASTGVQGLKRDLPLAERLTGAERQRAMDDLARRRVAIHEKLDDYLDHKGLQERMEPDDLKELQDFAKQPRPEMPPPQVPPKHPPMALDPPLNRIEQMELLEKVRHPTKPLVPEVTDFNLQRYREAARIARVAAGDKLACEGATHSLKTQLGDDVMTTGGNLAGVIKHEYVITREGLILDPTASQAIRPGLITQEQVRDAGLSQAVREGVFTPEQWNRFNALAPRRR